MEIALLATAGAFIWWMLAQKKQEQAEAQVQQTQSPDALAKAKSAIDAWLQSHPGGTNPMGMQQAMFEVPDVSGATINKGFPRIMKIAPKAHWWTSRFQTGTSAAVVFQNDDDLVSTGLFPKGSIVAYLGITTDAGCDPQSDVCSFQRSYVTGSRTDGTMLLGWVESSDLVEV
jgi:hypothetical protein